jgi:hypothetical protein
MEAVHFVIPGCAVICLNQIRRFLSGVLYYVEKIDDRPSAKLPRRPCASGGLQFFSFPTPAAIDFANFLDSASPSCPA